MASGARGGSPAAAMGQVGSSGARSSLDFAGYHPRRGAPGTVQVPAAVYTGAAALGGGAPRGAQARRGPRGGLRHSRPGVAPVRRAPARFDAGRRPGEGLRRHAEGLLAPPPATSPRLRSRPVVGDAVGLAL
eukprot:8924850-Pyramimonas_sp.AAC.1